MSDDLKLIPSLLLALPIGAAILGCSRAPATDTVKGEIPEVPYAEASELSIALATRDPVLLEFCVPVGCERCDRMRPEVNELAQSLGDGVTVRRVNLNERPELAALMGIRVCPTYILLRNGQEAGRFEFPTSADLLADQIAAMSIPSPPEATKR